MCKPIISFITTVYNNEKYVENAIESVMKQNNENIELILIDDGSTDNTPQILDNIALKYNNVRVIHQENQWIYASFNNGIKAATGEYVYILNSDDCLMDGAVQLLLNKINEYAYPDVIWTKVLVHICDEQQNIIKYDVGNWDKLVTKEKYYSDINQVRENWLDLLRSNIAQNQANLYKRELAVKFPFRNDIYGADFFFNMQIASSVRHALILKEPIYAFYNYEREDMNASCGKYYAYEHEMFNDEISSYLKVFKEWNLPKSDYIDYLKQRRLRHLTHELKSLQLKQCNMSIQEKLETIFNKYMDDTLAFCGEGQYQEELESRVLSGVRQLLIKEDLPRESKMYFVYELLESLLRYEKDEVDYTKIESAINHPLNPYRIGKVFFEKLNKNKEIGR